MNRITILYKSTLPLLLCCALIFSTPVFADVPLDTVRDSGSGSITVDDKAEWDYSVEAESGDVTGTVRAVSGYGWASGGTKVGWFSGGDANSLTIAVTPPRTATAKLTLRYCSGETRELRLRVNGEEEIVLSNLNSGNWNTAATVEVTISLIGGQENTIQFYSQSAGADLDKLSFNMPSKEASKDFPANPIDKSGYRLIFNDEFSGNVLDTDNWVNSYLSSWTKTPEQALPSYVMQDGIMSLRITPETQPWCPEYDGETVVSGFTTASRNAFHNWTGRNTVRNPADQEVTNLTRFGYFEIRAKAQIGSAHHVAWWLTGFEDVPRESSELDIFEILGKDPRNVMITNHPWKDPGVTYATTNPYFADKNFTEEFHVFALSWEETPHNGKTGKMIFYVDNQPVWTIGSNINYPMASLVSLYEKRGGGWTGQFDPSIPYPKKFDIDYIRIYKKIPDGINPHSSELAITEIESPIMQLQKGAYSFPSYTSQVAGSEGSVYTSNELAGQPSYVRLAYSDGTDTHQWVKWDAFTAEELAILNNGGQFIKHGDIQGLDSSMSGFERANLTIIVGEPEASNVSTNIPTSSQYPIENIFDGVAAESSKWISASITALPADATVTFDLKTQKTVEAVRCSSNYGAKQGISSFDLDYWDEATGGWISAEQHKGYQIPWTVAGNVDAGETVVLQLSEPVNTSKIRLNVTGAQLKWMQIIMREIEFI